MDFFFHEKSFTHVDIIFFRSKFAENSPVIETLVLGGALGNSAVWASSSMSFQLRPSNSKCYSQIPAILRDLSIVLLDIIMVNFLPLGPQALEAMCVCKYLRHFISVFGWPLTLTMFPQIEETLQTFKKV